MGATYEYLKTTDYQNGEDSSKCIAQTSAATTNSTGDFQIDFPVPSGSCSSEHCVNFSGPFGPAVFHLTEGTPAGYFLKSNESSQRVALVLVEALFSDDLNPSSSIVVSVNAPVSVQAIGLAADGSLSPANLSCHWVIRGLDWIIVGGPDTSNVTIEGLDTPGAGLLTVWVNGSYNGSTHVLSPLSADLIAIPTTVTNTSASAGTVDAGQNFSVVVDGRGAADYSYEAVIMPGIGQPQVLASCDETTPLAGWVSVSCLANLSYDSAGTAIPTGSLTNGYSGSNFTAGRIVVNPKLSVTASPSYVVGSANETITIVGSVVHGTGTPPYGPACLNDSIGPSLCESLLSGNASFELSFQKPGDYAATVVVSDAAAERSSVSVPISIVGAPSLGSIAGPALLYQDVNSNFSVTLLSGVGPFQYWWNDSEDASPLSEGVAPGDGPIGVSFAPPELGPLEITIAVLDALGSRTSATATSNVVVGPASQIVPITPSPADGDAGGPVGLSWEATDSLGRPVSTFAAALVLQIRPIAGTEPVNLTSTSTGANLDRSGDNYSVPSSAWKLGYLNLTADTTVAGWYDLQLSSPTMSAASVINLTISPDVDDLVLSSPNSIAAPHGENATIYTISDIYGNLIPGGLVFVRITVGATVTSFSSPILAYTGRSVVWVNYSIPEGTNGSLTVLSQSGQELLNLPIHGAAGFASIDQSETSQEGTAWIWWVIILGVVVATGVSAFVLQRRIPGHDVGDETEIEIRRWAEGRARLGELASATGGFTLDEVVRGWVGDVPSREDLSEWIAGLITEGVLRAEEPAGGPTRYFFTGLAGDSERDGPLAVDLDPEALEQALAWRAEADEASEDS